MVRERAKQMRCEGYEVYVEDQNKFSLPGRAATLGGKPDLVGFRDGEALVVDCKSGQQRDSDFFQVLVYMWVLPHTHSAYDGQVVNGEVQYRESRRSIASDRLSDELKTIMRSTIERLGADEAPAKLPSWSECRFCDFTAADCPERIDEEPRAASVEHDLF
jgi:hypothetical protein